MRCSPPLMEPASWSAALAQHRIIRVRRLDASCAFRRAQAAGAEAKIFQHGQIRKHKTLGRDHRHAERDRGAGRMPVTERPPGKRHLALPDRLQPKHRLKQRGLAGAVVAEECDRLAPADRKIDVVEHALLAVTGGDAGD